MSPPTALPTDAARRQPPHPGVPAAHQAQEFGRCEILALLACAAESERPICVEDAPGRFLVFTARELRQLLRMFDAQPGEYVSVADDGQGRGPSIERRPGAKLAWFSDHPDRSPVYLVQDVSDAAPTWSDSQPFLAGGKKVTT